MRRLCLVAVVLLVTQIAAQGQAGADEIIELVVPAGSNSTDATAPAPDPDPASGVPQPPVLRSSASQDFVASADQMNHTPAGASADEYPADPSLGIAEIAPGRKAVPSPPICGQWQKGSAITGIKSNGERGVIGFNDDICLWWVVGCGTERIDESRTGALAGGGFGAYAEALPGLFGLAAPDFGLAGNFPIPAATTGLFIDNTIQSVRGADFGAYDTINFWSCRREDTGAVILAGTYGPSYSIGSSLPDNFSIATSREDIRDALEQQMQLHLPAMTAIPPIDRDHVYVRFPMWFWLDNLVTQDGTAGQSDLATIRISMRATFVDVDWRFGPHPWTCTESQMRAYDPTVDFPTRNIPECTKTFTKLQRHELTATANYFVEERIQYRMSAADPWPPASWSPHAQSNIAVFNTVGEIAVGEILSLVVAAD